MPSRTVTREHKALCRLLKKQWVVKGLSLGQVGKSISVSRSGVHHFVNGTGGRLPDEQTFEALVRTLGADPTAEIWKSAYAAACRSYGKATSQTSAIEKDANRPQRPRSRRGHTGSDRASLLALVVMMSSILATLLYGAHHGSTEDPPRPPASTEHQRPEQVNPRQDAVIRDGFLVPIEPQPNGVQTESVFVWGRDVFRYACVVPGVGAGAGLEYVKVDLNGKPAYIAGQYVVNVDSLFDCRR
ncbi:helix-turn-helix domain-containing protein [Streptomyces rochei]|uniref:helix-turn-helix domain-containing protein n=1 Tax=Streptomyces rochei TaxID=1928 RepID=UPI0036C32969